MVDLESITAVGLQMVCGRKDMKNKANSSKKEQNFCTNILHV